MDERTYIDRYTGKIERTDRYLVRVILKDGTILRDLEPKRLFPITRENEYITLLDKDEHEAAFVRQLDELDDSSAEALRECFLEYYRIPTINKLYAVEEKFGSLTWDVGTNLGRVRFRIRSRHADIKHLSGNRIFVRDINDNRYEIPDWCALDPHSRRLLFDYL